MIDTKEHQAWVPNTLVSDGVDTMTADQLYCISAMTDNQQICEEAVGMLNVLLDANAIIVNMMEEAKHGD